MREIPFRIREIIYLIKKEKSIGYTQIKKSVELSDPVLIKYLKFLRENNVVKYEKKGKNTFYSYNYENDNGFLESMSIPDVIVSVLDDFYEESAYFKKIPMIDFLKLFERKISSLFFYCALKSIFDKKEWIEDFDFTGIFEIIIEEYIRTVFSKDKLEKITEEYFIHNKYSEVGEYFRTLELSDMENRKKDKVISIIFDRYEKEFDFIEKKNELTTSIYKNN